MGANRYRINQLAVVPTANRVTPQPIPPQSKIRFNRRRGRTIDSELGFGELVISNLAVSKSKQHYRSNSDFSILAATLIGQKQDENIIGIS
jgi:hypothetical protein